MICAVCGETCSTLFYSVIEIRLSVCEHCFNNPALWIPTKERCEQVTREAREESRRNPTQSPLWRFF